MISQKTRLFFFQLIVATCLMISTFSSSILLAKASPLVASTELDKRPGVLEPIAPFPPTVLKYLSFLGLLVILLVTFLVFRTARNKNKIISHTRDLQDRTKELQCIFNVAEATKENRSIEELLKTVVEIIPNGWQYPERTQALITFDNHQYFSENFTKSPWVQSSDIIIDGQNRGRIEVHYLEGKTPLDESPFLLVEQQLIITISQLLSETLRAQLSEFLFLEKKASYKNIFHKMLNGFAVHEIICDSTGKPIDYRFLDVNPAFGQLTGLTAEMVIGKTVRQIIPNIEQSWIDRYGKVALTGEPELFEDYVEEFNKHFEVTAFSPALNQFACIFADITLKKEYETSQANYRDRLQSLAYKLANAEVLLRQDIAARLHDSIGQDLAALKLNIDIMRLNKNQKKMPTNEDYSETVLDQISDSIDDVVHKVWNLSFQLCPPGLFKAGFVPTLEWLVDQFKSKHEIDFRLIVESYRTDLDKPIRGLLFQMIRELIVNAIKHANSTEILIVLEMQDNNLHASIIDNGRGFNVLTAMTTTDSSSGFGLFSIKERLAFLTGKLEIDSAPNQGTKVSIILPLTNSINLQGEPNNETN